MRKTLLTVLGVGLGVWVACNAEGPTKTQTVEGTVPLPVETVSVPEPARPLTTVPNLTAFIDKMDEACYVTNKTGLTQNIRFRVFQVNDLNDPANMATQTKLWDQTTAVPDKAVELKIGHGLLLQSCHLYQFDCGRGEGLLDYKFKWGTNPCDPDPTPTPSPSPTPTPTPSPSPTPTPDPGICHVSNKGVKDNQVNLVLSYKQSGEGHVLHLDPSKFCPPDHLGPCSCEKAIADAQACGVPAAGGFVCKIEGTR